MRYLIVLAARRDEVLVSAAEARVDGEVTLRQPAEPPHQRARTWLHKKTNNYRNINCYTD